jgi:hypothetical protein
MERRENKTGLIYSPRVAVVVLCLTGFVAAWTVYGAISRSLRVAVHNSQHNFPWVLDLRSILPAWAAVALNLGIYAYLLWLGVMFYRYARGKERIVVAGWFAGIFLGPIQILLPASATAVDDLQAVGMIAAFLAAIYIVRDVSAKSNLRLDDPASRNV